MIRCPSLASLLFLAALAVAAPAGAHNPDPLTKAPFAPAPGANVENLTGELKELVVEDRVANVTVRYRGLVLADGTRVRLRGEGFDALPPGSRVEITGQRNGETMFARAARELESKPMRKSTGEGSVRASGKLQLYYVDFEDHARTTSEFDLLHDDGTITPLKLDVRTEALQRGMRVAVSGMALEDGAIEPDTVSIESLPATMDADTLAITTDKVLVILMRFTDSPAQPFTQAEVQAVVAGGPGSGSVAEYYKEVSYGQKLLNVTVTPWLSTGSATPPNCDWRTMGTIGNNKATASGYNTANYQKIVYVFPKVPSCAWLGLAYVGGSGAWINGANTTLVYGHELGHNLGLLHSGTLDCGGNVIGGTCTAGEYTDPFNIMGASRTMHIGASQKFALGWIPSTAVKTHTAGSAIYTLDAVEAAGGTTYAIKVQPTANRTYWVEYRKPIGFDAPLASFPYNGVQIRLDSPFQTLCSGCDAYSQDTQLLDTTPTTSSFTDAALLTGKSFADTTYGITFNVLSVLANSVQVQVVAPGGASSTTSLTSALNPSTFGVSVRFTATVTGTAPTGTVSFKANGTTIAGCSATALVGTGNVRTAVCETAALAAGTHSIVASYSGDGSNPASASSPLSQTVNPAAGGGGMNVALAANGGIANASSTYSSGRTPAKLIDDERKGAAWNNGYGGWQDATVGVWPDWAQIDFSGSKTIDRVVVYSLQDNYTNPVEPTDTLTGTLYLARDFVVQGWNGAAWVTLATVTNNTLVKRTVTFTAYATPRIRVHVTGSASSYTRLTEVQAWTSGAAPLATTTAVQRTSGSNPSALGASVGFTASVTGSSPTGTVAFKANGTTISGCSAVSLTGSGNTRTAVCATTALALGTHSISASYSGNATNAPSTSSALSHTVSASTNVALATSGATASASSTYSTARTAAKLIDNERKGAAWNIGAGGWQDATVNAWPDWAQINFSGNKTIDRVVVYSLQDNYASPVEPTDTLTGTLYLARDFVVQGWNGSTWITLATVTNNTLVKRTVTFAAYTTSRIRVQVTKTGGSYTRLTEVEAWGQ